MEEIIQEYLTDNYYVYNKGDYYKIYIIDSEYQANGNKILKELFDIYGLEDVESKIFIYRWSIKSVDYNEDIDLTIYWDKEKPKDLNWSRTSGLQMGGVRYDEVIFPMVQRAFSKTLSSELVRVQPMSSHNTKLMYVDTLYGNFKVLTKYERLKTWFVSIYNKMNIFITKSLFIPINNNTFVTQTK